MATLKDWFLYFLVNSCVKLGKTIVKKRRRAENPTMDNEVKIDALRMLLRQTVDKTIDDIEAMNLNKTENVDYEELSVKIYRQIEWRDL